MRIDKLPSGRAPSLGRNLAPCTGCLQIPWEHFATQRLPDPLLQHPLTGRLGTPCGAGLPTLYRDPPVSLCTRAYVFSIKSRVSDRVQCIFGRLGSGNCLKASRYTPLKFLSCYLHLPPFFPMEQQEIKANPFSHVLTLQILTFHTG